MTKLRASNTQNMDMNDWGRRGEPTAFQADPRWRKAGTQTHTQQNTKPCGQKGGRHPNGRCIEPSPAWATRSRPQGATAILRTTCTGIPLEIGPKVPWGAATGTNKNTEGTKQSSRNAQNHKRKANQPKHENPQSASKVNNGWVGARIVLILNGQTC